MGRKHLLPVAAPLHCFQNGFEIAPNQPYPRGTRLRQTHSLKHKQPGVNVLFTRTARIFSGTPDSEVFRVRRRLRQLVRVRAVDCPVERRKSPFVNFATF
jgi:hypothetical protein